MMLPSKFNAILLGCCVVLLLEPEPELDPPFFDASNGGGSVNFDGVGGVKAHVCEYCGNCQENSRGAAAPVLGIVTLYFFARSAMPGVLFTILIWSCVIDARIG